MGLIENTKEIAELIKKIGDIELYRKIVELEDEILALSRENRQLTEDKTRLESKLKQVSNFTFRQPFWYADGDTVPHCPKCWERDKTAVHLFRDSSSIGVRLHCPACKNHYPLRPQAI